MHYEKFSHFFFSAQKTKKTYKVDQAQWDAILQSTFNLLHKAIGQIFNTLLKLGLSTSHIQKSLETHTVSHHKY